MSSDAATIVLSSLTTLLPQLISPPFSPSTLVSISHECTLLKQYGIELEQTEKQQLDLLQGELTRLCQDTSLDLQLRLQLLELIELRTLGWETNESMESFYKEKFQEVEEKEDEEVKTRQRRGEGTVNISSLDEAGHTQEMIQVGEVKLFISSSNKEVITAAKQQLQQFFSPAYSQNTSTGAAFTNQANNTMYSQANSTMHTQGSTTMTYNQGSTTMFSQANTTFTSPPIPSPTHQYSREILLTLANSQEAMKAPLNWARRVQSLPRVIVKQQR